MNQPVPFLAEQRLPELVRHLRDIVVQHGPDCLPELTVALKTHADALLTQKQFLSVVPVSQSTLRVWKEELGLPYHKPGGGVCLYRLSEAMRWIEARRVLE